MTALEDWAKKLLVDGGIDPDEYEGKPKVVEREKIVTKTVVVNAPTAAIPPKRPIPTGEPPPGMTWPIEPADYIDPQWADYVLHHWSDDQPFVLLTGPCGTGKSLLAQVYAARNNRPFLRFPCRSDMEPAELYGRARLDTSKGDYWSGVGPLPMAAKHGAVLLLDEFNVLPPACQAHLNEVFDTGAKAELYVEYTGERLAWDTPRVIAACNEAYAGTREIQQALRDRAHTLNAEYLPPDQETALVIGRSGIAAEEADKAVKCANAIRTAARGDANTGMPLDFDLSPRAIISWARQCVAGREPKLAWKECILGRIGWSFKRESTREAVEQISKAAGLL